MLRALDISDFPPFANARMLFPVVENKPADLGEVHLLTGINGTGKTRLLSLIAAALGNPEPLKRRVVNFQKRISVKFHDDSSLASKNPGAAAAAEVTNGDFSYSQGGSFHNWATKVPAFAYSGNAYIVDSGITVLAGTAKPERTACLAFVRPEAQSSILLQAVADLMLQAAMDEQDNDDPEAKVGHAKGLKQALEKAVRSVTGKRFAFAVTAYPKPAISATWGRERLLPFVSLPDGLRSIIGWLAHAIVMMDALLQGASSPLDTEAVFLLDEIEGFLHPAWQRKILPAFQSLFPKAQIFVTTHSPFLIASLNHGWIHQLTMQADGTVVPQPPRAASEGDSYITVVEDIMGVKELYDPETENLLAEFRSHRDAAFKGDALAQERARTLAALIGHRSMELGYMMGRELHQMDRQLVTLPAA